MTNPSAGRALFRSIITLIGGFAIYTFLLMLLGIVVAVVFSVMPGTPIAIYLLGSLTVSLVAAAGGGYAAAALAPNRPYAHANVTGVMVLLSSINGIVHPPAGPPAWYPYILAAVGTLGAIGGGLLRRPKTSTVPIP